MEERIRQPFREDRTTSDPCELREADDHVENPPPRTPEAHWLSLARANGHGLQCHLGLGAQCKRRPGLMRRVQKV